ncbi:hypothetical protein M0804_010241 [Polistes exclamans]|nr:hypothetical protein M0804_010241 [Polistes exclamans]
MSCCEGVDNIERSPGTGCCGTNCTIGSSGCSASESQIRSCHCQKNVGCLNRNDCGGFRPSSTAATGACPGPCQCLEEEIWNSNVPPKPNCEWLTNFSELRRQWSNHARKQNCKCCNCRSRKIATPCRPCLPTTPCTSGFVLPSSDCQDHRLAGGASDKRDLSPTESTSSRESSNVIRREVGGGCPPPTAPGCGRPCPTGRCRSPSTDRSSSCSWNPSCIPRPSSPCRPSTVCQSPCSPSPKSILKKKRSCCQCTTNYCMCQPMPRNCNCPPPVQIDARAQRDCTCNCPSSPECACPPSERRFPRTMVKCPNSRLCCPLVRLPPGPKCHCNRCQPCLPAPCDPCTSSICRNAIPRENHPCCPSSPCPKRSPCRPKSPDLLQLQGCRSPSPSNCRKSVERYCIGPGNYCRDDICETCPRIIKDNRSSSGNCGRTGQSSTICRRRAGGDDTRQEIIAMMNHDNNNNNNNNNKDESTNRNISENKSRDPFSSGYCEKGTEDRKREQERECKRDGGGTCSCELDSHDCYRRIDRSDEIRSDVAFNHTYNLNTVTRSAYQRHDKSDQGGALDDIDYDYSRNLGSINDDSSCHSRSYHRDTNNNNNNNNNNVAYDCSRKKSFQDYSKCRCSSNETGCDISCDHCCSYGVTNIKDEPSRCRCAPDGNGCDKTCNYCCAFNDSNVIIAGDNISVTREKLMDVRSVISNGDNDNRRVRESNKGVINKSLNDVS